jgi:hypothetical protein
MDWELKPGEKIVRKDLHATFGGRPQGGIGPSNVTPNVFLFTDPLTGHLYGYLDGWDGQRYHYYGEGRFGDQRMASGNASVLRAAEDGRTIRLFEGSGGEVTYSGVWELDPDEPYYETDAPDFDGQIRKVIVFKLVRTAGAIIPGYTTASDADETVVQVVPVEEQNTETAFVNPSGKSYTAQLVEGKLVQALRSHLTTLGHAVDRLMIHPKGEGKPLFSDLWDATGPGLLIEAKGTVTREAVRMAIGQLLDYGRFKPQAKKVILVPERPRSDLIALAGTVDATVVWPEGKGYAAYPALPW